MSKISFTVSVPHDGPHIPQFSVSCNNATYLSFKGKDIGNARFGNGNIVPKKGWKRLEFGVTGGVAATRVSVMVNTSVILPPLAWSTPGPAPAASVARGGSTATKKDLRDGERRNEAKLLKEDSEGAGRRLRIEDGDEQWKSRGHRSHRSQRASDEKGGRSRADRGERVRRSDRRRLKDVEILEDPYLTDEEDEPTQKMAYHEDKKERVRRRDRRKEQWLEDSWEEQSNLQKPRRKHYDNPEPRERRGRSPSVASEADYHKKVAGKKLASKYRKSGRDSDTSDQQSNVYLEEADDTYKEGGNPQYRRSRRRQDSLRPVDFGFDADVAGD